MNDLQSIFYNIYVYGIYSTQYLCQLYHIMSGYSGIHDTQYFCLVSKTHNIYVWSPDNLLLFISENDFSITN